MAWFNTVGNISDILSLFLDIKNWSAIANLANLFRGRKPNITGDVKVSTEPATGNTPIKENEAQLGELYTLLAWLSGIHDEHDHSILEYKMKAADAYILPEIVKQLKPGAIDRFLRTLAVELATVRHKKPVNVKRVPDPKDPNKSKELTETEEWETLKNERGPQIVAALAWLVNQSPTRPEGVTKVATTLNDLRLFANLQDQTKGAFERFQAFIEERFGSLDTAANIGMATWKTNWKTAQYILGGAEALRLRQAAKDAKDPKEKRGAEEALQRHLLTQVTRITQLPPSAQARFRTKANRSVWKERLIYGGLLVILLIGILFMGTPIR